MTAKCPVCGQPAALAFKPFCSRGCKDRDLLRWLDEGYKIPGPAADPDMPDNWPDSGSDSGVDKADRAD